MIMYTGIQHAEHRKFLIEAQEARLRMVENKPKRFFKHHWTTPDFGDGLSNNLSALISIDAVMQYDYNINCIFLIDDEELTIDDEEKERFEAWLESWGVA